MIIIDSNKPKHQFHNFRNHYKINNVSFMSRVLLLRPPSSSSSPPPAPPSPSPPRPYQLLALLPSFLTSSPPSPYNTPY